MMPAVVYGRKQASQTLLVSQKDFKKVWKTAGENMLVAITEPKCNILIHSVSFHPSTDEPVHADFYAVEMDKKIEASIPLVFQGVAPAIKELGGVLVKVMHEIEVESLPAGLPHELIVDIQSLVTFENRIFAGDIKLPEGVTLKISLEEIIALVEAPREEEIEKPVLTIADIEVEKKGKKEEDATSEVKA